MDSHLHPSVSYNSKTFPRDTYVLPFEAMLIPLILIRPHVLGEIELFFTFFFVCRAGELRPQFFECCLCLWNIDLRYDRLSTS